MCTQEHGTEPGGKIITPSLKEERIKE